MNERMRKIVLVSIVTAAMLLSVFSAVPMGVASSATPRASVGTVTLSPATGAFPGQIVYFTWTGVPTDLVPPVYVTVYLNGAAYSTSVAYYDSGTGTLKGSFVMPNDEPGTVFDVSFSYRDSAKNYGTNTVTGEDPLYISVSPTDYKEDEIYQPAEVPYTVEGETNYTGAPSVYSIDNDDDTSNGTSMLNATAVSGYDLGDTTHLYNDTTYQDITLVEKAEFTGWETFINDTWNQNLTLNATLKNMGTANLAAAANAYIPSTFTFDSSGNITSISTSFTITQNVEGVDVTFAFSGVYNHEIGTAPTTATMMGTFVTTEPATLAGLTGQFSLSYQIQSFGVGGGNYYVNYSISLTFQGTYEDVNVNIQYVNSTVNHTVGSSATFTDTRKLDVLSGYTFTSATVGLVNPGIDGKFEFNFYNSAYDVWVNNTYFTFSDYQETTVTTLMAPLYFNESVILHGFNDTNFVGEFNVTITTVSYTPGVFAISPAIWEFQINYTFEFNNTKINVTGNTYGAYYADEYSVTAIHESQFDTSVGEWYLIPTNATLKTLVGYPKVEKIIIHEMPFNIEWVWGPATIILDEVTITPDEVINSPGTYHWYTKRSVEGFNETFNTGDGSSGIPVYNSTGFGLVVTTITPAVYGYANSGHVEQYWYTETQANNSNGFIWLDQEVGMSGPPLWANVTVGLTSMSYDFTGPSSTDVYLEELSWYITDAEFSGYFEAIFGGYSGSLEFWGYGNETVGLPAIISGTGYLFSINGNLTAVDGFENNSAIGGWFNATVYVDAFYPALYGVPNFDGYAMIGLEIDIKKNTSEYPYFEGYYYTDGDLVIPTDTVANFTVAGFYEDSDFTLTAYMTPVRLVNVSISGSFEMTWSDYGIDSTYTFHTPLPLTITPNPSTNYFSVTLYEPSGVWFNQTSGEPNINYDKYMRIEYEGYIGKPIANVTLVPLIQADFYVYGYGEYEGWWDYYYYMDFNAYDYYETTLNIVEGGMNSYSSVAGWYPSDYFYQWIMFYNYEMSFSGVFGGIDISTGVVTISDVGDYYIHGTANSLYGSGVVTGTLTVLQHIPYSDYMAGGYSDYNNITFAVELNVQVYNANGEQTYIEISTPTMSLTNSIQRQGNWLATVPYSLTTVTESPNEGTYTYGNYKLEQGSGALIVTLSDEQIATIVTRLGDVVNISLEQLDAKLVGIWSDVNDTYALVETAYGDMSAKLDAIDAKITDVKNGIATIQTTLGNIQTSLSNLDAKITSLQGDVATVQTALGDIQVSLEDLNAAVEANANSLDDLKGSVATIQTSLGEIKGTITDIKDGVATIETDLGTVKTDVSDIKTTTEDTSGSVSTTLYWEIGVLILVIITLVLVAYVIIQVNKLSKSAVKEETVEETSEETE